MHAVVLCHVRKEILLFNRVWFISQGLQRVSILSKAWNDQEGFYFRLTTLNFSNRIKFGRLELTHGWKRLSNMKLIFPLECHFCLADNGQTLRILGRQLQSLSFQSIHAIDKKFWKRHFKDVFFHWHFKDVFFHFPGAFRQPLRTFTISL